MSPGPHANIPSDCVMRSNLGEFRALCECGWFQRRRSQNPPDVVCLAVLWRVRYKLSLRDVAEMFLERGLVFMHEAVREWESKLAPVLSATLRKHRRGKIGRSWYCDETYLKVIGMATWRTCC